MLGMNTAEKENVLVIELQGALDSQTSADFKSWIEEKMLEGFRGFALDFSSLEYLSSRGIGAILEIQKLLQANSGNLALFSVSDEVMHLLDFLRITEKITVTRNEDEAVRLLTGLKKPAAASDAEDLPGVEERIEEAARTAAGQVVRPEPATSDEPPVQAPEISAEGVVETESAPEQLKESRQVEHKEPASESEPDLYKAETEVTIVDTENLSIEEESVKTEKSEPEKQSEESSSGESAAAGGTSSIEKEQIETTSATENNKQNDDEGSVTAGKDEMQAEGSIIDCPNCGNLLRVSRLGKYLCPACRYKFTYSG